MFVDEPDGNGRIKGSACAAHTYEEGSEDRTQQSF